MNKIKLLSKPLEDDSELLDLMLEYVKNAKCINPVLIGG